MDVVLDNLDLYIEGARTTIALTLLSYAIALIVGIAVAACRVSPVPPLRVLATAWVELVRNTPLAVLFLLFWFGFTKIGIKYGLFTSAIIVLSAYTSTFIGETVRAGINSVSKGQAEAARSLGLTFPQTLVTVVLPQALRTVVAPLGSLFIALIKNSSVAGVIGVIDLTAVAAKVGVETAQPVAAFAGAATGYVILALFAAWAVRRLEHRTAIRR
ncbi:MAG: amino acid ABC transporter permease [Acidimicrobiales bacterium]